jgi:hypothetical protein
MEEKRKEPRSPVMIRAEASWIDENQTQRTAPATIVDRPSSGLCIRFSISIGVGSKLTIKQHSEQFSGLVAYSRRDKGYYFVGIQRDAEPNSDTE